MEVKTRTEKFAYSLSELSEETSMSVPFWRKEIAAGRLKAKLVGRRVVVMASDAEKYFESRRDWTPTEGRTGYAIAA